jgi:UDP-glucose 4-epimerase
MVDTITVKDDSWKIYDFSRYDAVFHVAGIVHLKEKPEMENLYFSVNRDLALEVAKKAKLSGVRQFVFMSSMSVYGLEGKIGEPVVITKDTPCHPNTFYGRSKYEAEQELQKLNDESFKVAIIRAPMIYGPNCPGNYERLRKLVLRTPVFPLIENERSMLFIDNLCECIRLLLHNKLQGLFCPQNVEYVNTSEMVKLIAMVYGRSIYITNIFSPIVKLLGNKMNVINKVFGNLVYEKNSFEYKENYAIVNLKESIIATEKESSEGAIRR